MKTLVITHLLDDKELVRCILTDDNKIEFTGDSDLISSLQEISLQTADGQQVTSEKGEPFFRVLPGKLFNMGLVAKKVS